MCSCSQVSHLSTSVYGWLWVSVKGKEGGIPSGSPFPSPSQVQDPEHKGVEGKAAIERWGAAEAEGEEGGRQSVRKINFRN